MVPSGHSPTVNRRGAHLVTVLALLLVALAPHVGAFLLAGRGRLAVSKTTSAASCVKRTRSSQPWGSGAAATHHDHEQPVLGGGLRGATRRCLALDDATVGDVGEGASRDDDSGGGGGVESKDIWAGAELPLSNNQQVEQATGALWKVNCEGVTPVPLGRGAGMSLLAVAHSFYKF